MFRSNKYSKWIRILMIVVLVGLTSNGQLFAQAIRIMPLGNSLTAGLTDAGSNPAGGYRDDLATMLTAEGVDFNFVGSQTDGSGFDADHEGHPGWQTDQINAQVSTWLTNNSPDIVLFMGGTNDIKQNRAVNLIIADIEQIVDKIHAYNANTRILVSSIIPRRDGLNGPTIELNDKILEMYNTKLNAGYKIYYAGHFEMFTANSNWAADYMNPTDLFHCNNAGYELLAKNYHNLIMNAINSVDPIVKDNFNRATLGDVWAAAANYVISGNELFNNAADEAWNYLATFKGLTNPTQVSVKISSSANAAELDYFALAVMLDAPTKNAGGYMVRITSAGINVWTLNNGSVNSEVGKTSVGGVRLQPGDEFKVALTSDGTAHHFDCYINDGYLGRFSDTKKLKGNVATLYSGVFIRGNQNCRVDNFNLFKSLDHQAPDIVTNLEAGAPSANSVPISWTAPGDDGVSGNATGYDLRYATGIISETNFAQATQITAAPKPLAPGTRQSFVVTGLKSNTKYFFALKTFDEANNYAAISNVVSATTTNALVQTDNFDRTGLGADWAANAEYQIVNGALDNTATTDTWDHIAIYLKRKNSIEARITWDKSADVAGINQGGFALLMSDAQPTASGYLLWRRTNLQKIGLFTIVNGVVTAPVGSGFTDALLATPPAPGDEYKVVIRSEAGGHFFDCYLNNQYDGTVGDTKKEFGNGDNRYFGIVLHGGRNNNVDAFSLVNTVGSPSNLTLVSGNNQEGAVGKPLPSPIIVMVSDVEGMPVSNYKVDFAVTEGGGGLDKAVAIDGNIRVEAEECAMTAMYAEQNTDCGGGAYVTGGTAEARQASVEFKFYIEKAGDYYIWGRVNPTGSDQRNSWYWKIDESQEYVWDSYPLKASDWAWDAIGSRGDPDKYTESRPQYDYWTYKLTVGLHTLTLIQFDKSTKIDKIFITNVISTQPSGKEEYPEYRTDGNGEAQAIWTLGPTFGTNNNKAMAKTIGLTGSPIQFIASALGDVAANIAYISGRGQSGPGGVQLANAFVVKVTDAHGNPRKGHPVNFTIVSGGGHMLSQQPILTDATGQASDFLILGTEDNTSVVNAVSEYSGTPLTGSPIQFTATATSMIAHEMKYLQGDAQNGFVNEVLAKPLEVKIVDNLNNAIPNHNVRFRVTRGSAKLDGAVSDVTKKTDANGKASVTLTLSTTVDSNQVEVSSLKMGQPLLGSPLIFKSYSKPLAVVKMAYASGNNQTGAGGSPLAAPLVVKVMDQYNNGVSGHAVTFTVQAGGAKIEGQNSKVAYSDGRGLASVVLTLGTNEKEINKCMATSVRKDDGQPLEGSGIEFQAQPGKVSKMQLISGNNQEGSAGYLLDSPFVIKVLDNFDNPVPGFGLEFHVKQGEGTINGKTDTVIVTGADGKANCHYTLGYAAGAVNKVQVEGYRFGVALTGNPIVLTATSFPATELQYQNGTGPKDFSGTAGLALTDSIKTRVIDSHGRALKRYKVNYKVTGGGGKANGQDVLEVLTNSQGFSVVSWRLGPLPGTWNNLLEASATYNSQALTHSPRAYRASAKKGDPAFMIVQGDSQKSVVGSILEQPIKVRITDPAGNAIISHQVNFKITAGNGKLNDAVREAQQFTDSDGYVQVRWRISTEQGWTNTLEVTSQYGGKHLAGSPASLYANGLPSAASALARIGPEVINGPVGQALPTPFQVKATDSHANGVSGMQITFEVTAGGGTLDGTTETVVTRTSDQNGACGVVLTLGPKVGVENIVKATAFNGSLQLQNSPMFFRSTSTAGPLDLAVSTVVCEPNLVAAGENATVVITLTDAFGNPPTERYWTTIKAESDGLNVVQDPQEQTNAEGKAFGQVRSNKAGIKYIKVNVLGKGTLVNRGQVRYLPLAAHHIGGQSGNNQTGNVNAALSIPLGVTVYDRYDNPVPEVKVTFTAGAGGSEIYEPQPVSTDTTGQAFSHFILGAKTGVYSASVAAAGINQSLTYQATAVEGAARYIEIYAGNRQNGVAGIELRDPLVVKVTDSQRRPVFNHTIRFYVEFGDGKFKGSSEALIPSDPLGLASAYYTLDKQIGINTVKAESPILRPQTGEFVTFVLDGRPGSANVIHKISGDGAQVRIYGSLTLKVRTTDFFDNGVGDINVTFRKVKGDFTIEQAQPVMSNSDGYATSVIRVGGVVGPMEIEAVADGLVNSPLKFTIFATAAEAVAMQIAAGDGQKGTISRQLAFPFEVLVKDNYGNPVQNAPVAWSVISGSGSMVQGGSTLTTLSDETGLARNYLILGPNAVQNEVYAINRSLKGSPLSFKAEGVTNKFPLMEPIPDKTVKESQLIEFQVKANDEDGDVITYGARVKSLPSGASYDSLGTQKFSWRPGYQQAGIYNVWFLVRDNRQGIGAEEVQLTVENVNRPPERTSYWPLKPGISGNRLTNEPIDFTYVVKDPDPDDIIVYNWFLTDLNLKVRDSLLVSTTNGFHFKPAEYGLGPFKISIIVTDGHDSLRQEWKVSNKDAVELSNFSATVEAYQGVALTWETSYEHDNMGFNILRGNSKDGEYKRLNRALIPAREDLQYEYFDRNIQSGRTYYYVLEDVEYAGRKNLHAPIAIEIERPENFELAQNYPNPFNPMTRIRYQLPEPARVMLVIYNITGQRIRTLVQEAQPAGYHFVVWDGCNEAGQMVASGIYFYQLVTPKFHQIRRMVLLR
ncbi:GDSL-type esterase/lipase family protein [candidate division KSB1 bacterium]|nr:GDSL-type esterase/lipase family protein [candidate division KSB1 bacterium]